ncbi:cytochrome P450 family protein [Mycobacterium xenopi 3993]|nr:cytochrome P450 family protein [Mycobacterium xenopi 3993]
MLQGFRNSTALSNAYGVSLDPVSRSPDAHKVMSFLAMDDPGHLRLRTLVSKGFTPRRIRELEPRVQQLARIHLDAALQSESFDFIAEFAGKLPMDVISELMGVPEPDRPRIRALADGVLHREDGLADVPQTAVQASIDLMAYYTELIGEFKKTPADNLTSALLQAEIDGDRLTDEEILAFLFLMVIAGNETTTKLLGNAVYWAARNPDQLARVVADHSLIPAWVEETLRYDTSSQILAALSHTTLRCTAPRCPKATCCCCCRARLTATTGFFPTPTTTASDARSGQNWSVSAAARISVWEHIWRGWKAAWP